MEKWERRLQNQRRPYAFVYTEYKKLLQVGKTNSQAETILLAYCGETRANDALATGEFFVALALAQWNLGRLSDTVKEYALSSVPLLVGLLDDDVLEAIKTQILAPMPAEVAVAKPRVRHCPWREGSLLAYRIQNSETAQSSPYWNKYVLLRVVKIVQRPVAQLAPDACFNETMLVGLYDWFGDSVPNPADTVHLKFTAFCDQPALLQRNQLPPDFLQKLAATNKTAAEQIVQTTLTHRCETCFSLLWDRASRHDGTITFLGIDSDFPRHSFDFKTNITDYSFGGVHALDCVLCKRLETLYG